MSIFNKIKAFFNFSQKENIQDKILFIDRCNQNGIKFIKDLNSSINKQRCLLIAKEYNICSDENADAVELFKRINSEVKDYKQREEKRKFLKALREKEYEEYVKSNEYAYEVGVNKRIAPLTKKYNEYYKEFLDYKKIGEGLNNLSYMEKALDYSNKALDFQEKIEKARYSVVANASKEEIFENIEIKDQQVKVSETGAIYITAMFSVKDYTTKYFDESIDWVVDGCFVANIYDGDKMIGSAKMVIPFEGISTPKTLRGIFLQQEFQDKEYSVEIAPSNIWIIEK